jgi:uncharacterized protein (TIGR03435 family)
MLHEHFNLVVHVESQWTPAYRLVRARSGGALGPGLRPVENCVGPFIRSSGLGEMSLRCVTMDALASPIHLWERLGRPIVDDTGMTGAFDLSLVYAPTPEELKTIYELDPENVSPDLASRPSIFDAVQAQLGLRLEPTQTPVQSLVVDWADRPTQTR